MNETGNLKWIREIDGEFEVNFREKKWISIEFAKKIVNWKWN